MRKIAYRSGSVAIYDGFNEIKSVIKSGIADGVELAVHTKNKIADIFSLDEHYRYEQLLLFMESEKWYIVNKLYDKKNGSELYKLLSYCGTPHDAFNEYYACVRDNDILNHMFDSFSKSGNMFLIEGTNIVKCPVIDVKMSFDPFTLNACLGVNMLYRGVNRCYRSIMCPIGDMSDEVFKRADGRIVYTKIESAKKVVLDYYRHEILDAKKSIIKNKNKMINVISITEDKL